MNAEDFYSKAIKDNPEISIHKLMEGYAKHIIRINFCDLGADTLSKDLRDKRILRNLDLCIDWANDL